MTEKSYGGNNGVREHLGKIIKDKSSSKVVKEKIRKSKSEKIEESSSDIKIDSKSLDELESYLKAGEILKEVRNFAKSLIKKDMLLVDIAKKIEDKITELGGEVAFPVNLSIDDIAAHYHPTLEDTTTAKGLLKIDLGIHINGYIADSAFTLDLSGNNKHKELINASLEALEAALKTLDKNPSLNDIGKEIQKAIENKGFSPIVNLCGHSLERYNIHAGITIPNHANNNPNKLDTGAYAIEPFATYGEGKIFEGPPSNIYCIVNFKTPRGPTARKILEYVWKKKQTLPFSLREVQEKFGPMSRLALKELEQNKIIHSYPQLIEVSHKEVAQAEHTFIKTIDGKIIVTTK
ncbi:MAG: type II methionyl aminopeptidase [Nanoarchaeota archaeon]|nr:type II methionyl aminopeptidase [Nanoarchaeota archaeon]